MDWQSILKEKNSEDLPISEIVVVIEHLNILINDSQFLTIDEILKDNLNEKTSATIIVTLLRSTFYLKEKLPSWQNLLTSSRGWLRERGENYKRILIGLS